MKIEIGESLTCSWLRHVRQCWLVQANWKVSEHWEQYPTDAEIEELFRGMKSRFDHGGGVFGRTKDARQFLKQGEIDVVGVDREGSVSRSGCRLPRGRTAIPHPDGDQSQGSHEDAAYAADLADFPPA